MGNSLQDIDPPECACQARQAEGTCLQVKRYTLLGILLVRGRHQKYPRLSRTRAPQPTRPPSGRSPSAAAPCSGTALGTEPGRMRQVSPSYATGPRVPRPEAARTQHPARRRPEAEQGPAAAPHTQPLPRHRPPSPPVGAPSPRRQRPQPPAARPRPRGAGGRGQRGGVASERGALARSGDSSRDLRPRPPLANKSAARPRTQNFHVGKSQDGAGRRGARGRSRRGRTGREAAPKRSAGGAGGAGRTCCSRRCGGGERCAAAEGGAAPGRREGPGPAARPGAAGAEGRRRPRRALSAGAGRRRGVGAAGSAAAPRGALPR